MSSFIRNRTIASILDGRIVLSNSDPARLFSIGTTWQTIRVALRMAMTDSGASLVSLPRFAVGVCSGTANRFGAASTTNWVGSITNVASWTRSTSPIRYAIGAFSVAKKVGATLTAGGTIGTANFQAEAPTGGRFLWFTDITKGSPNYSIRCFIRTSSLDLDVTKDELLTQAPLATPSLTGHAYSSAVTIAASEAAGSFDAVNIAWDRSVPEIEICDLVIVRLA